MTREIYNLFDSLTPETVPRQSPGTKYLHQWENDNAKDDWRADGYCWRQNGPQKQQKCEDSIPACDRRMDRRTNRHLATA